MADYAQKADEAHARATERARQFNELTAELSEWYERLADAAGKPKPVQR